MVRAGHAVKGARVTVLGLTFKEDCPDLRNSRVIDILRELESYDIEVQVADPLADPSEARAEYGVTLTPLRCLKPAQAVVVAVSHRPYRELTIADLKRMLVKSGVLVDVKSIYDPVKVRAAGIPLWRL
jgi:UDP-N-acetyl-D-galactosamine dehydrogenase